jgi:hypothetical protein
MEAVSGVCSPMRLERSLHSGKQVLVVITDREHFDPGGRCREVVAARNSTHVASYPDFDAWQVFGEPVAAEAVVSTVRPSDPRPHRSVVQFRGQDHSFFTAVRLASKDK